MEKRWQESAVDWEVWKDPGAAKSTELCDLQTIKTSQHTKTCESENQQSTVARDSLKAHRLTLYPFTPSNALLSLFRCAHVPRYIPLRDDHWSHYRFQHFRTDWRPHIRQELTTFPAAPRYLPIQRLLTHHLLQSRRGTRVHRLASFEAKAREVDWAQARI